MSLFQFHWLKRFIQRHTKPIPVDRAALWKQRLSLGYVFFAWNAFGLVIYMMATGRADWGKYHGLRSEDELHMTPAQQWAQTLGIKNATVYRISSFKVKKYEIHNEDKNDETNQSNTKSTEEKQSGSK